MEDINNVLLPILINQCAQHGSVEDSIVNRMDPTHRRVIHSYVSMPFTPKLLDSQDPVRDEDGTSYPGPIPTIIEVNIDSIWTIEISLTDYFTRKQVKYQVDGRPCEILGEKPAEEIDTLLFQILSGGTFINKKQLKVISSNMEVYRNEKCQCGTPLDDFEWQHGYPGEYLLMCPGCHKVLDTGFDESEVI